MKRKSEKVMARNNRGFSLIEVLLAIVILALSNFYYVIENEQSFQRSVGCNGCCNNNNGVFIIYENGYG